MADNPILNAVRNATTQVAMHGISAGANAVKDIITTKVEERVTLVRNGSKKNDEDIIEAEIVSDDEEYTKNTRAALAAFNKLNDDEKDQFFQIMGEEASDFYENDDEGPADALEDDEEEEEEAEDYDNEDNDSPLPMIFDIGDAKLNLEAAAAARRLWGCKQTNEFYTLIANNDKDGSCFVGTMNQLAKYSSHHDLDDTWTFYGLDEDMNPNNSDFSDISISKDAVVYVSSLASKRSEEAEGNFRKFHWNKNEEIVNVVKSIPGLEGKNLSLMGVAHAIIYYAEKGGEQQVFIHEFGEDSGRKPMMYSMPNAGEKFPRTIVINGGNMRVEGRGIVD